MSLDQARAGQNRCMHHASHGCNAAHDVQPATGAKNVLDFGAEQWSGERHVLMTAASKLPGVL